MSASDQDDPDPPPWAGHDPQGNAPAGLFGPAGAPWFHDQGKAAYGRTALETECRRIGKATRQTIHSVVYEVALRAGSLVAGGCLVEATASARIEAAVVASGIEPKQLKRFKRHILRGMKKGMLSPRGPVPTQVRLTRNEHRRDPVGGFAASLMSDLCEQGVQFKGHRGNTAWAVLAAICAIAEKAGKHFDPCSLSYREIGEVARVGTVNEHHYDNRPIRIALDYLVEQGAIERLSRGRGLNPGVYRIIPPSQRLTPLTKEVQAPQGKGPSPSTGLGRCGESIVEMTYHAVWERGGLGVSAQRVHHVLSESGLFSTRDLVDRLGGLSDQTVRTACKRLVRYGLAEKDTDGRWPRWRGCDRSLDEVAVELGVEGRDAERRSAHVQHRADHREAYDDWRRRCSISDPETTELT